jgi:hypothetical protein
MSDVRKDFEQFKAKQTDLTPPLVDAVALTTYKARRTHDVEGLIVEGKCVQNAEALAVSSEGMAEDQLDVKKQALGEPSEGLSDNLAGAESSGDLGAPTPSPANMEGAADSQSVGLQGETTENSLSGATPSATTLVQRLVDALNRMAHAGQGLNQGKPVRNLDEVYGEANQAIAEANAWLEQQEARKE